MYTCVSEGKKKCQETNRVKQNQLIKSEKEKTNLSQVKRFDCLAVCVYVVDNGSCVDWIYSVRDIYVSKRGIDENTTHTSFYICMIFYFSLPLTHLYLNAR